MNGRMGRFWEKFSELGQVLLVRPCLLLKQGSKEYHCCIRVVLLHCSEIESAKERTSYQEDL